MNTAIDFREIDTAIAISNSSPAVESRTNMEDALAALTLADGVVLLTDLSHDALSLILCRLQLAHDIARVAKASKALKIAAELAFAAVAPTKTPAAAASRSTSWQSHCGRCRPCRRRSRGAARRPP